MLGSKRHFPRVIGHADLAKLVTAIERDIDQPTAPTPAPEVATLVTA